MTARAARTTAKSLGYPFGETSRQDDDGKNREQCQRDQAGA
jgi:hypothetical protein